MKPVLEIHRLSKRFRLRHESAPYENLRDRLGRLVRFRGGSSVEEFWALKDVSFSVNPGDAVGIIGRNGAGKSTLLKILSRITPPTSGSAVARGRIASLLEVGTGFHPELSGRENVFLNGSILGMKRNEIRKKFDAIVDFSGVERFLDTPLKHYSSGMQLRLAFSVAAFLEPEILLVDEVLAVGDAEFQRKCIGKMSEVANSGRTILFVSHQLGAVRSLCKSAVYLKDGHVREIGSASEIIERYLADSSVFAEAAENTLLVSACGRIRLSTPVWVDTQNQPVRDYHFGDLPRLRFRVEVLQPVKGLVAGYAVRTQEGSRLFTSHSMDDPSVGQRDLEPGTYVFEASPDLPQLAPGRYDVPFGIKDRSGHTLVYSDDRLQLNIEKTARARDAEDGWLYHTGSWRFIPETKTDRP
jgi:lipopolysaccharide transport system ATP-binding protein